MNCAHVDAISEIQKICQSATRRRLGALPNELEYAEERARHAQAMQTNENPRESSTKISKYFSIRLIFHFVGFSRVHTAHCDDFVAKKSRDY